MHKIYSRSNSCGKFLYSNTILANVGNNLDKTLHASSPLKFPLPALKLPTNVVDINATEMGRFSPQRDRDISGPVINYHYGKQYQDIFKIDITSQPDPHVNKYDCRGAVSLSSSMQSNVPSPFSGNHTHLNMPGSQWGQGHKYLSEHLHSAHYLTLRNQYRNKFTNADHLDLLPRNFVFNAKLFCIFQSIVLTFSTRNMSSEVKPQLSAKEKLKKAVKDYGSTVIVFHVSISLLSLGGCYLLISSGVDIVSLLKYFNIGEGTVTKVAASNAGTFVVAYAAHKLFAPVRIAITLGATPFIVRYLRNIGILKHNLNSGGGK